MERVGPSSDKGAMTAFTREPSGRRASTAAAQVHATVSSRTSSTCRTNYSPVVAAQEAAAVAADGVVVPTPRRNRGPKATS